MTKPKSQIPTPKSQPGQRLTEPRLVRWALCGITLIFLLLFLVLPMGVVFLEAFRKGLGAYANAVNEPDALAALKSSLIAAAVDGTLNTLL